MAEIPGSIRKLRLQTAEARRELRDRIARGQASLAPKIRKAARDTGNIRRQGFREAFYKTINSHYDLLGGELDVWGKELTGRLALDWHRRAVFEIRRQTKSPVNMAVVKFDRRRVERYWRIVHPDNAQHLAGQFTQGLASNDILALRNATIDTFRQAQIEGWTANQIQKNIQSSWDAIAGNLDAFRFIDARGRAWSNANYLRMLTRTIAARVSRESYLDTIVENGDDLVRIQPSGDSCMICDRWVGLIISISGKNPNYPSYRDSLEAGMWHPNCDCFIKRVDETVDAKIIEEQADTKNARNWNNLDQVQEYRESLGLPLGKVA